MLHNAPSGDDYEEPRCTACVDLWVLVTATCRLLLMLTSRSRKDLRQIRNFATTKLTHKNPVPEENIDIAVRGRVTISIHNIYIPVKMFFETLARKQSRRIFSIFQASSGSPAKLNWRRICGVACTRNARYETRGVETMTCIIWVVAKDTLNVHGMLPSSPCGKIIRRYPFHSIRIETRSGFLFGANSKEESLCMRTTLYIRASREAFSY
ncbi:uncharacterized protein EV420DRAFT_229040 [Desarmillaria tabescens]|uniref:Uncharacterized protein n=1 Tax=Armillaria tabescens TaxID=1929756 RepID=A0AA39N809_ARMTA|nr:uncharacterized protein EV420DRAFT_229040 [Desarmillaria tabescens]KAK0460730.1 hypothetical protein EV420DRAFT_229040 [Desarmillaria tabescens]